MKSLPTKIFQASSTNIFTSQDLEKFQKADELKKLHSLMPSSVDLKNNPDLLGIVLNAAVGGMMNRNFHAISNASLVEAAKKFLWKRVDLNHDTEKCVGVICNYGFSKFGSSELISEEEAAISIDPVNLSLAILVWSDVVPEAFLDVLIESANPSSNLFQKVSASWEILYSEYDIAVSSSLLLKDAVVYSGEDKAKFEKYLPLNKGKGFVQMKDASGGSYNYYVFAVLNKNESIDSNIILPVGIGLVKSPAAFVEGLSIVENENIMNELEEKKEIAEVEIEIKTCPEGEKEDETEETPDKPEGESEDPEEEKKEGEDEMDEAKCKDKASELPINLAQKEEIISTINNNSVNSNIEQDKPMVIKSIKELTDENLKTLAAANVLELFEVAVKEANSEYETKLTALAQAETERDGLSANLETVKAELSALKAELSSIRAEQDKVETQARFNSRLSEIIAEFEVTPEAKAVIAKDLAGLDASDESYNSFKTKLKALLSIKKSDASVIVTESEKENSGDAIKVALAESEKEAVIIPNSQDNKEKETLSAKYTRVFNTKTIIK